MLRDQKQALENLSRGQRVSGLEYSYADIIYQMGRLVDKQVITLDKG